jgi:hypothetical protein
MPRTPGIRTIHFTVTDEFYAKASALKGEGFAWATYFAMLVERDAREVSVEGDPLLDVPETGTAAYAPVVPAISTVQITKPVRSVADKLDPVLLDAGVPLDADEVA